MTDQEMMQNLDAMQGNAIQIFATDEGVAIGTVAKALRDGGLTTYYSKDDLAHMLSLSIAEKAHAIHEGDWA